MNTQTQHIPPITTATASNPVFVPTNVEALLDPNLSDFAFRALCYLAFRSNVERGGIAWPSIGRAADDLAKSYNSVLGGFQEAVERGYADPVGKTPGGVVIYHVIRNGKISDVDRSHPQIFGDPLSRKLETPSPENWRQNKDSLTSTEEQQPPTPKLAESPESVVVVFSPSASQETASIQQEPPQATIPTKAPISQPTPPTANRERFRPTVGIVNGETLQAPPKTEPTHPPAFHHSLSRKEAAAILVLLAVLPSDIQALVLSEFIAQLDGGNVRRPIGYMRRLVEVAKSGKFVPSAAREAAQRAETDAQETEQKRKQAEEERAEEEAETKAKILLDEAKQKAGNDRLAELRADFILRLKEAGSFTYQRLKSERFQGIGFGLLFDEYLKKVLLNSEPPQG